MPDVDKLASILSEHKQKNFVKRILQPDKYPKLKTGYETYSTHKMAYSKMSEDQYIVYPTVIYNKDIKQLLEFSPRDAIEHALETDEYISFDTAKEADWFSKNYKKVWDESSFSKEFWRLMKGAEPSQEQLKTMEHEGIPLAGPRTDLRLKGLFPFGVPGLYREGY